LKNLTKEQHERGETLYREILLLNQGWNPRPYLPPHIAKRMIAKNCLDWLEAFREKLYPNTRPFKILLIKHIIARLIEDDFQRWIILDDIKAAVHTIVDQDERHVFHVPLWRDEVSEEDYSSMLQIVKRDVNERYAKWLGGDKE